MVSVIVLNTANGLYQNSIYGLVGSFPYEYINAVVLGNNICGLFVTILCALIAHCKLQSDRNLILTVVFSYQRPSIKCCCLLLNRPSAAHHLHRFLHLCQEKRKDIHFNFVVNHCISALLRPSDGRC